MEVTLRRATRAELWRLAQRQPRRQRPGTPLHPPRRPALDLARRLAARYTQLGRNWALWATAHSARGTAGGPAYGRDVWTRLSATFRRIGWPWPGPARASLPAAVSASAPGVAALYLTVPLTLRLSVPTVAQQAGAQPLTSSPATPAAPAALIVAPRRALALSTAPGDAAASILAAARFASPRQRLTPAVETRLAPLWAREAETLARQAVYLPRSQPSRSAEEGAVDMWLEQAQEQTVQRVPRVLARPAPAPVTPAASTTLAAPAPGGPALQYWDQSQPPRAPAFSAGDIDHLTDQVIKTLDERLISARERLGKPGRG